MSTREPGPVAGASDERVDELRQRLRSLGYLDAGVDRFVLGSAQATRRPAVLAVLAGVRIGLLSALLLGPIAAAGLSLRIPGLVSSARDALVLAFYLGALFFMATALLSAGVSLIASAFVRAGGVRSTLRAQRASRLAAWSTTIACLAYLTLWWRAASTAFAWNTPLWTVIALATAAIVSLLLGHAVRISTLAVLGAATPASLPPVSNRSWRVVLVGGALAFFGGGALLIFTAPSAAEQPSVHPPLTVVSAGRRVRLVAIDGFDAEAAAASTGRTGEMGEAGAVAALEPQDTTDPARAWTTIATGVSADVHGVAGIETRRVAGVQGTIGAETSAVGRIVRTATDLLRLTRPSITSREERRAKTVWEVAAEAGLRTAVINWWATWPATANNGIVITDRAVLRLERGGTLDGEIAPPPLYEQLRRSWPALRERAAATAAAAFVALTDREVAVVLRRSAELDGTIVGLLNALPGPRRDLDVIYLPGLDIAQHTLLASNEGPALPSSAMAARIDGLRAYYRFLDQMLAPTLARNDDDIVIVVTQPGRVRSSIGGFMTIAYGGFVDGSGPKRRIPATVFDVMPTVMAALGLPLSRELRGAPTPPFNSQSARRYVDTYGKPNVVTAPRAGQPLDQEMIDRLRSLGYVR